jgi:hypothetical protein
MGGSKNVMYQYNGSDHKICIWIHRPLTLISDQGIHFINDTIGILTNHFLLQQMTSTTYYLQGNGQA